MDAELSPLSGAGRVLFLYGEFAGKEEYLVGGSYRFAAGIGSIMQAAKNVLLVPCGYIDGWVVLPEHMHAIWTLPEGDDDFSSRWKLIKTHFSKSIPLAERRSNVRVKRGECGIWQR